LKKENGLIDWTRPAPAVCNQVRAMQPWPTAYTWWHRDGKPPVRLMIARCRAHPEGTTSGVRPGSCLARPGEAMLGIAGGQGVVEILELQPSGKRHMEVGEFLRGHAVGVGDWFGPETE